MTSVQFLLFLISLSTRFHQKSTPYITKYLERNSKQSAKVHIFMTRPTIELHACIVSNAYINENILLLVNISNISCSFFRTNYIPARSRKLQMIKTYRHLIEHVFNRFHFHFRFSLEAFKRMEILISIDFFFKIFHSASGNVTCRR